MRVAKGQLQSGQIRIMFRKLKVDRERTNADLSAELDLMRLQSIVRRRSFCLSLRYGLEDLHCRHHPGRHVQTGAQDRSGHISASGACWKHEPPHCLPVAKCKFTAK